MSLFESHSIQAAGPERPTTFMGIKGTTRDFESFDFAKEPCTWSNYLTLHRAQDQEISVTIKEGFTADRDIKNGKGEVLFHKGDNVPAGSSVPIFVSQKALDQLKDLQGKKWELNANPGMSEKIRGTVVLAPATKPQVAQQ